MKIKDILKLTTDFFKSNNIQTPKLDALLLFSYITGWSKEKILTNENMELTDKIIGKYREIVKMRKDRIPTAYITGRKEFYSNIFNIVPGVLIPRPDTEIIVDKIIEKFDKDKKYIFCDLGTGTGCILISLLLHFKNSIGYAVDIKTNFLDCAYNNAELNKIQDRIHFIQGDCTEKILYNRLPEKIDILVSNPPYVSENEWNGLEEEILKYEDKNSVVSGETGLEFYNSILSLIINNKNIFNIFLEIGYSQKSRILDLVKNLNSEIQIEYFKDLENRDRVIYICRHNL